LCDLLIDKAAVRFTASCRRQSSCIHICKYNAVVVLSVLSGVCYFVFITLLCTRL